MSDPRPLLRLLPHHDRRVKTGHPWAFSNEVAITPAIRALPPGSVVRLEGDDGWNHGTWAFNPHSLIAARRLSREADAKIDLAWVQARLATALALREKLFDTLYYRLVHAEADGLPGLVIDRYGDTLALQANTAAMQALTTSSTVPPRRCTCRGASLAARWCFVGRMARLPAWLRSIASATPAGTRMCPG